MSTPNASDDEQKELVRALTPIARNIVEKALRGDDSIRPSVNAQVRSLATGLPRAHRVTTIVGALVSAIIDLDRDLSRGAIPKDAKCDDLAIELIRLAYNRWQRERRVSERLRFQTSAGEHRISLSGQDLGGRAIDQKPVEKESPENIAHFRDVVDQLVEQLTPQDIEILLLFAEDHSIADIAERIGCHRTTISRKLDRFAHVLRKLTDGIN